MEVYLKRSFIKDFKKLPLPVQKEVKEISTEYFPRISNIRQFKSYPLKKMRGFKNYYRIRLDGYRIGFKKEDNKIIFMRVLHRKDIYKYFP